MSDDSQRAGGGEEGRRAGVLPALRGAIARIEGRLAERLDAPREAVAARALPTDAAFDALFRGGLPAGLTEMRLEGTRDAGAGAGFAMALGVLAGASARRPIVWIGERHVFAEAGRASGAGMRTLGLDPAALLLVVPRRLEEALWAGEEAARSGVPALVVLEARGNPRRLGLEGTRRLHVRAKDSGCPFVVLRQAGRPETSAAPVRLAVSGYPGTPPAGLSAGRFLGAPAFKVAVEKSRDGRFRQFLLEWNAHEQRFCPLANALARPFPLAAEAVHGPHPAGQAGAPLALRHAS